MISRIITPIHFSPFTPIDIEASIVSVPLSLQLFLQIERWVLPTTRLFCMNTESVRTFLSDKYRSDYLISGYNYSIVFAVCQYSIICYNSYQLTFLVWLSFWVKKRKK